MSIIGSLGNADPSQSVPVIDFIVFRYLLIERNTLTYSASSILTHRLLRCPSFDTILHQLLVLSGL